MNTSSLVRLLLLSAIWGASFLFMRISAPILGPVLLIFARVSLAAVFLFLMGLSVKKPLHVRQHWRHYLMLGVFNSALPFFLFAISAKTLSASLLSILNATAPIWGALVGAIWLRSPLTPKMLLGMLLGVIGVGVLAGVEAFALPPGGWVAIAAALGAPLCYGIATTYTKTAKAVEPFANAHGNLWAATALLLPFAIFAPPLPSMPNFHIVLAVLALGVACSGIAYLLYFRLIADIGATSALTVTFLIPAFGMLWGTLFLHEHVGWHTLFGTLTVLAGTVLITGYSFASLLPARLRA